MDSDSHLRLQFIWEQLQCPTCQSFRQPLIRIGVTNDKDFGDIVFRDNHHHHGILLLRLADDRVTTKIRVVAAVLKQHVDRLQDHFVVATEQNIRIRSSRS